MRLKPPGWSSAGAPGRTAEIYNVFLTAAGRKLRTRATALALQVDARAMRGVKPGEIEQVLAILKRLRGNLADNR